MTQVGNSQLGGSSEPREPNGAPDPEPGTGEPRGGGLSGFLRETVILVVLALALAIVFKTFLIQAFFIPSASMENTLLISDRVMVEKLSYRFGEPKHGDIVVFIRQEETDLPEESDNPVSRAFRGLGEAVGLVPPVQRDFIKRVIGLPGDRISCRDGHVVRNGQSLNEPYIAPGATTECTDNITVPPGHLFVMGDNRGNSADSRVFGPVDEHDLVGRAFVRIWPLDRIGWLRRS